MGLKVWDWLLATRILSFCFHGWDGQTNFRNSDNRRGWWIRVVVGGGKKKKNAFVFFSPPSGGPAKIDARMTPKQLFLPFVPEARYAEGFSSAAARGKEKE